MVRTKIDNTKPWHLFSKPGVIFKFLKKNPVCFPIELGDLPEMDLIHELGAVAAQIKQKKNKIAYELLSDLVSILVASTVAESHLMIHELTVRDVMENFDDTLTSLLTQNSESISGNMDKNIEPEVNSPIEGD